MSLPIIKFSYNLRADVLKFSGESMIVKSPQGTLYKIFDYETRPFLLQTSIDAIYNNKLEKLKALAAIPNLRFTTAPSALLYHAGQFCGYEMPYNPKDISLKEAGLDYEATLTTLRKVRFILNYLYRKDITYADVNTGNILVNADTNQVKLCDMDNVAIGEFGIDATLEETDWFLREYGKLDENVVAYMYNLLALEQIAYPNRSNYEILYSLGRESEIPGFNNEVGRVVEKMLHPKKFDGEDILQYVKKR